MATEGQIFGALNQIWASSSDSNWILGRLGARTGTSAYTIDVVGRSGYVYVSLGVNGDQGQAVARDGVGVAKVDWQQVKMRRENNALVIREAEQTAGGGSGGGASNLNALTDVTLSTPADGNTLQYNSATGQWVNVVPPGGPGGAPYTHPHHGPNHSGKLPWSDLDFVGSNLDNLDTRLHSDLQGIGADDHHDQHHVLATATGLGGDHSISGAAAGQVLRASGPTAAQFAVLKHTDLDPLTVLPDQHHPFVHDIIANVPGFGKAHTVSGADFTVVGVHPANTLDLLPTSSNPGAAVSILKTDANGGIQLDTNLLYVDGANNWIGINVVPGTGPAGGTAALDILAFSNADHTQRIRQKSGQTGRLWRIENTVGHELIVMDSDGSLMSGNPLFVSGQSGWNITPEGNAEFNNIWARGELHATVFVKDEVHATGGTFFVATAGVLFDDAVIDATVVDDDVLVVYSTPAGQGLPLQVVTTSAAFSGNELHVSFIGNSVDIEDPRSGPAFYFQPGDIIRVKTEINPVTPDTLRLADLWLEVNNAVQKSGYATYNVTKRAGSDCKIPKGTALVSYGHEGDGRIMMTSDLQFAPYIDVFTTGKNVWLGAAGSVITRMRMGRLDGIKVPGIQGIEQYGLVAGKDLTDANQGYLIASNLQFSLYKVDIRLNNGGTDTGLWTADGNLRIGKNVGADATTGLRFDAVTGDLIIGNPAGTPTAHFLRWSQSTGKLTVQGDLLVSDPATSVSLETMTNADNAVRSDAGLSSTGYAGIARDTAIGYSDARRITGVSGTWASPGTNRVSWTSLAVVFASPAGSSRSIAAPAAPGYITISTRTYLYVSMAGTGTMTMQVTTSIATVSAADNVLIAVCDPGDPAATPAARLASIAVVAGSTYISGGNIFTGSITATNIATRTLTADRIKGGELTLFEMAPDVTNAISDAGTSAQTYGDNRRVLGVSGTWTVVDGATISWSSLQLKVASGGTPRTIASRTNYAITPPGRHYLYVDLSASGTLPMQDTTDIGVLGINHALIAVVDSGADMASINVVAGSTYISGSNIMAGSVTATQIKAFTITAGKIDSSVYVSAGGYRVAAVSDSFSIALATPHRVDWSAVTVRKGDGTNVTISPGSIDVGIFAPGVLTYLYIPGTVTGTTTMLVASDVTTIPAASLLIAIVEEGADAASYSVVAGGTLITGDQIITGSIVAGNIKSGAVTAAKINVNGNVDIAAGGAIRGNSKAYQSNTPGFFLGHNGGLYKFDLGDDIHNLRWDGAGLVLNANSVSISSGGSGFNLLSLSASSPNLSGVFGLATNSVTGTGSAVTISPALQVVGAISTDGDRVRIATQTPTSYWSGGSYGPPAGVVGEIRWSQDGIYVYTGSSFGWRRATLSSFA